MYICVLTSTPDEDDVPYNPSPYMKGYRWKQHLVEPTNVEKQIKALIDEGVDAFVNLCDGTPDDALSGIALVHALEKYNAALIVDEAHATGVIGEKGVGLVQKLNLQNKCFARIHTFGKACGAHGAIILGSEKLKKYLINFSRPFIYSTSLPPSAIAAIAASYKIFPTMETERSKLEELIIIFQSMDLKYQKLPSATPIQAIIIPGNERVKRMAEELQESNFDIRPILYPTVPKGSERLRIVLHSFNTKEEIEKMVGSFFLK